jgi:ferredoxin
MNDWERLQQQVIQPGNCTHCGACVGLCPDLLDVQETDRGPLPHLRHAPQATDAAAGPGLVGVFGSRHALP